MMMDEDEDEDMVLGMSQALPVSEELMDPYEFDLPPASGMEYLRRVRLEASQCPATVTVELKSIAAKKLVQADDTLCSRSSAIAENQIPSCSPAPQGYAPSVEWQNQQVSDFSRVRMNLSKYLKEARKSPNQTVLKLPASGDMDGWHQLCFGRRLAGENFYGSEQKDDSPKEASKAPPLISIICRMDQQMLLTLLEYHIGWFEANGFTEHQGQWFYAMLAALEKPLLPEAHSLIRTLARICSNLRASLDDCSDSLLPQLNLLICLVSRYFEQKDLADNPY